MLGAFWTEMLGYLPFTRESRKFWLENQMAHPIPFGSAWEPSENMGFV